MESVTFDSTASSIQIKASVSTAGRQTAISLQQHLPNKTSVLSADLSFLNSDTKRMYKLGNQRIIKECHYNYQSLKASQLYSRLKFHIIYFIFKSPDICDPLSKYGKGGGGSYIEYQMLNSRHIVPTDSGKNSWESNATEAITNRKSQLCQISHFLVVSRILIKWSQLPV